MIIKALHAHLSIFKFLNYSNQAKVVAGEDLHLGTINKQYNKVARMFRETVMRVCPQTFLSCSFIYLVLFNRQFTHKTQKC